MTELKQKNWFIRHKILTAIIVLVGLGVIGAIFGDAEPAQNNSTANKDQSNQSDQASSQANSMPKIGQPARDGKFEFVAKSLECGKESVGTNQYLTKEAQGQFCLLNISVKNVGDAAQSLFSSNQKLLNAQKQQYAADDSATTYATPDGKTWYNNINPGNSVEGVIVFDIPKDQTPTIAELHDSMFSSGVKVDLAQ